MLIRWNTSDKTHIVIVLQSTKFITISYISETCQVFYISNSFAWNAFPLLFHLKNACLSFKSPFTPFKSVKSFPCSSSLASCPILFHTSMDLQRSWGREPCLNCFWGLACGRAFQALSKSYWMKKILSLAYTFLLCCHSHQQHFKRICSAFLIQFLLYLSEYHWTRRF